MKGCLESRATLILFSVYLSVCFVLPTDGQNVTSTTREESKQFDMVLRFDGSTSYNENNTVVRGGAVLPTWSSRCRKSNDTGCTTRSVDEYTDQLFFEFSYDSVKNFNFRYPSIKSSGGRARPQIIDYSHDLDEKNGEIIVTHSCVPSKNNSSETSIVELFFPLTSKTIMEIGWTKTCGYGDHKKLDYGFVSPRKGIKDGRVSLKGVTTDEDMPVFGPAVLSTRVYLKHGEDGSSQRFSIPVVQTVPLQREGGGKSTSKGLAIDIKGSGFGDIVLGKTASTLDIFYNCHERGVWRVEIGMRIVPFKDVKMKWIKDCGGGRESEINIATRAEDDVADVVSRGITSERFGIKARGTEKGAVSGKGSGTKAFFLWTKEWNKRVGSISIAQISAHSYNERIGKAEIVGINKIYERAPWGIGGIGEDGETIDGAVKRIIGVKVECRRKGRIRVGVTMSVHDRNGIEWWFYNDCVKEMGKKKGIHVTAGRVTYIMMGILGGMVVMTLRRAARRKL